MYWYTCMFNFDMAEKNIEAYCIFYNARERIEELLWVCTIKLYNLKKKLWLFRRHNRQITVVCVTLHIDKLRKNNNGLNKSWCVWLSLKNYIKE